MTSDSGHYIADADALLGQGVREIRHLPLFPALFAGLRLVSSESSAVNLAMLAVVAILVASFYFFVRGRLGHPVPELAATALFASAPTIAEAVGWYGMSMLLGLSLTFVAMRLIDQVMIRPRVLTTAAAGCACAGVALSHPFALVLLAEVTTLVLGVRALLGARGLFRRTVSGGLFVRRLAACVIIASAVTGAVLTQRQFYFQVNSPFAARLDLSRLSLAADWAFRENPWLWLSILLAMVIVLPLAIMRTNREPRPLLLWTVGLGLVCFANVAVLGGNGSFTTRNFYPLPATIAVGLGFIISLLLSARLNLGRVTLQVGDGQRLFQGLAVVLAIGTIFLASDSYRKRLDVALPYYNYVTPAELVGIQWLKARHGVAVVTAKGDDLTAGTQYAWMIEGLSKMRAYGPGLGFQSSLLASAVEETNDAERLIAGNLVVESEVLRAAAPSDFMMKIDLYGRVDGTWEPLFSISPTFLEVDPAYAVIQAEELHSAQRAADLVWTTPKDILSGQIQLVAGNTMPQYSLSSKDAGARIGILVEPRFKDPGAITALRTDGAVLSAFLEGHRIVVEVIANNGGLSAGATAEHKSAHGVVFNPGQLNAFELHFNIRGIDSTKPSISMYTSAAVGVKRAITYIYTWHRSGLVNEFSSRKCTRQAFSNQEIVIFSIDQQCLVASATTG
jgi:hypothetical protein